MRQRKETWILTFAGTTQAMQMEQYARAHGLPGRMIPVPREITAGCGLSWKAAPEEGKENVFEMRLSRKVEKGIESLPGDLMEAIEEFEHDDYIKGVLGPHITEKYAEAKKAEWADYRAQVTQWEIDEYLYKI